jgi:uncharacterized protein (TIGR02466 family)
MAAMPRTEKLFVTQVYRAELASRRLLADLADACRGIAAEDRAGQAWCTANGYAGYTSYASLTDLPDRASVFADLVTKIDPHARRLARALDLDLGGRGLALDSLWVNVLEPGGHHGLHVHPHSVLSGTFYVEVPRGASAIRFEDPRLHRMMAAPPRKATARRSNATFVSLEPKAGTLLLWESWLGHEVPVNRARAERLSVSFNYRWD